jgi:TonB family protein
MGEDKAQRMIAASALALLALAAAPSPPSSPPAPPIPPDHAAAMLAHYPAAARAAGVGGKAMISCARITHGAPDACKVTDEQPEHWGFGAAALTLAALDAPRPAAPSRAEDPPWLITFTFSPKPPSITPDVLAPLHPPPRMVAHPSDQQMLAVYPYAARDTATEGFVIMLCAIAADGRMKDCIAHANPSREGFEAAALKLAPDFRAATTTDDGAPTVGTTITIPILFAEP